MPKTIEQKPSATGQWNYKVFSQEDTAWNETGRIHQGHSYLSIQHCFSLTHTSGSLVDFCPPWEKHTPGGSPEVHGQDVLKVHSSSPYCTLTPPGHPANVQFLNIFHSYAMEGQKNAKSLSISRHGKCLYAYQAHISGDTFPWRCNLNISSILLLKLWFYASSLCQQHY